MLTFLKRLFCHHDYKYLYHQPCDGVPQYREYHYECRVCGKHIIEYMEITEREP